MRNRCAGSLQRPAETETLKPAGSGRWITLGACPTCAAWVAVRRNGALCVHVNWDERGVPPSNARREARNRMTRIRTTEISRAIEALERFAGIPLLVDDRLT